MDFFEQFDQARWEFTYGAPDNENLNALQVGLVAHFYIDQGYLPEKRQAMAEAFSLYHQEFGDKLKWGFYNDPNYPIKYHRLSSQQHKSKISKEDGEHIDFFWSSEKGFLYASDYRIAGGSPAAWYEYIHGDTSYMSFYLPVNVLQEKGRDYLENLLHRFCNILQPMHGLAGLGIQNCQEEEKYQHLEYEIGQEFFGLDVPGENFDEHLRNGIRSINWYTFFNDEWLAKLGGIANLQLQLNDPRIVQIPYEGGLIVRAGDWPELGWVKKNPYPELYVDVNRALKPIRAPEIGGMAYGSFFQVPRYDDIATAQWLRRFDTEPPEAPAEAPANEDKQVPIGAWCSEPCPYSGQWACWPGGKLHCVHFQQGERLPEWNDGQPHPTYWILMERDDGGSCFVET